MGSSSDAVPDPEAPRPPASPGPACRRLPWALSAALLLLLAAACAVCAVRAARGFPSGRQARLPDSPQDVGVFAQLVARDALLTKGLLHWYSDPGLKGVFLTPGLSYDEHTQELVVSEAGIYYVFLHLELQRVLAGAGSGSVSIALHLQPLGRGGAALALTLDLPSPSSEARDSAAGFPGWACCTLRAGQRLGVNLRAAAGVHPAWQLAQGWFATMTVIVCDLVCLGQGTV
ncbi:LOW QUALITY PROTEIN: tumor necrosis factor ligand superfamily member 9 [Myotis lucifugus]|uniref:LOW QUALITY PROTEIN: tumor necrosis factor ligand superfamily member 9 n=1 Tax=Myotis lucifugus TaxID=59463 RepID=UPI000CCC2E76|nr:LOW QUALITY PROTEIN: tumor necrosis factor ligand superfamily member 9 [Myotis lucifugus]